MSLSVVTTGAKYFGALLALAGVVGIVLAPFISKSVFSSLWGVEPLSYIGAVLVIVGLALTTSAYFIPSVIRAKDGPNGTGGSLIGEWSQVTQQYFDLFHHDLGRPLSTIVGKEREIRAVVESSSTTIDPGVKDLLDEIERQAPNFRLMMSNIQVLVQLESPNEGLEPEPVEPSELVRKIVDRYLSGLSESEKGMIWWAEPPEFGIVYSNRSAIEHTVVNLVDNAVRFAETHVEIKITKNPSHFFIRVWDDGPGISPQYAQHIFDRGWTPEVARGEEKPSSGLGLFIARTLARRYGGELSVETVVQPDPDHHTAFLLSLPMREP